MLVLWPQERKDAPSSKGLSTHCQPFLCSRVERVKFAQHVSQCSQHTRQTEGRHETNGTICAFECVSEVISEMRDVKEKAEGAAVHHKRSVSHSANTRPSTPHVTWPLQLTCFKPPVHLHHKNTPSCRGDDFYGSHVHEAVKKLPGFSLSWSSPGVKPANSSDLFIPLIRGVSWLDNWDNRWEITSVTHRFFSPEN